MGEYAIMAIVVASGVALFFLALWILGLLLGLAAIVLEGWAYLLGADR